MSRIMILLISIVLLLIAGCSPARQVAIDVSEESILNAEAMRQIAENCRPVCLIQIGFIEAALGNRMEELSIEDIEAIKELKILAEKPNLSDYELGRFLGFQVYLLGSVVQATLEKYAPNVIDILPLVF